MQTDRTVMTVSQCYECEICHGINHAKRFHCQFCNTVPTFYSWVRRPFRDIFNEWLSGARSNAHVEVYVAFGCQRQAGRRTIKRQMRTVPADYYATE